MPQLSVNIIIIIQLNSDKTLSQLIIIYPICSFFADMIQNE